MENTDRHRPAVWLAGLRFFYHANTGYPTRKSGNPHRIQLHTLPFFFFFFFFFFPEGAVSDSSYDAQVRGISTLPEEVQVNG
jgi:hypothetical protein